MTTTARRNPLVAIAMVMTLALTLVGSGSGPAEAATNEVKPPNWTDCFQQLGTQFGVEYECANVKVPLDYDEPRGTKISLALVRIPASDQANRIGSLFLNPGGPGGSGVEFALFFGPFAPSVWGPVANRYDIVGVDPRGIARSSPLLCFGSLDEALEVFAPIPFPVVKDEVSLFVEGDKLLDKSCRRNGTIVRDHMSTANVARDLDYLRQAVGDSSLNFVGLSYGSYLGQTYAKLFPDKVGAVVIDGVLDPEAWANLDGDLPFSTVLRSDAGAQTTLEEFFRQCETAGPGNCAFAPDSANRYDLLIERLRQGPVLITDPETGETFPYLYSFLVADTLGALYNPFGYAAAAEFLVFLESQANPAALGAAREVMEEATGLSQRREERRYPNFVEGFPAVACEDTTNPRGHSVWFDAGKQATAEFGIFGELWTWASSPCAVWSSFDEDVYKGPFATSTSNPVLVIGNLYDPATRYEGAVTARGLLSNSVLLTVDEPGHTSLGISGCAGFLTGVYLEDPASGAQLDGAVCPSEGNWFDLAASQFASELGQQFRTRLMEEIAFRP